MDAQNLQKKRRMQALGAQLAVIRQRQRMPRQEHLAQASGVSVRTISDIETGKKIPRVGTMRKIENALKLPPGQTDDFLEGKIDRLEPRTLSDYPSELYERQARSKIEQRIMAVKGEREEVKWQIIFALREQEWDEQRGKAALGQQG